MTAFEPAVMPLPSLRVGAVSYLNSRPLVEGLEAALPGSQVRLDVPSRLADDLVAGKLDLALVPIVEYLRHPEFRLVSDACIACRGPVLSVKLYFRTEPSQVKRLALDVGSRTSAALAQVLLAQLHGLRPELCSLSVEQPLSETDADAVLVIGDRAMQESEEPFGEVWDLGDRWCRWTELPFVFAAWVASPEAAGVARPGSQIDWSPVATQLQRVRDHGQQRVAAIAREQAARLALPLATVHDYLTQNLHFRLGEGEWQGIRRFAMLCGELGLVGKPLSHVPSAPRLPPAPRLPRATGC